MKDIIIKGGYGLRNFGDDALMYYLLKVIQEKYPNYSIGLVCNNSEYISKWFNEVEFVSDNEVPRKYYMYGGGTLYYSFNEQTYLKQTCRRIVNVIKNPKNYVHRLCAKKHKKVNSNYKKIMFGLGFGPFYHKNNKYAQAVSDIKSADKVCVRDTVSFEFARKYNQNVYLGTDICFATGIVRVNELTSMSKRKEKKIAVIVRDWNNGTPEDNYRNSLTNAVALLRGCGYDVTYVVFSDLRDSGWVSFLEHSQETYSIWNPDLQTIEEFMNFLSEFSVIISARFHGVIFSNILTIPSISITIEPKLELAAENTECLLWKPSSDKDGIQLLSLVKQIDDNYSYYVSSCDSKNKIMENSFSNMLDYALKND